MVGNNGKKQEESKGKEASSVSNDLGKITPRSEAEKELDGKANSGKTPRNRVIRRTVTQEEAECVDILLQAIRCSSDQEMRALVLDGRLTKLLGMTIGRKAFGRATRGVLGAASLNGAIH